jgi:general secretion pathway protein K
MRTIHTQSGVALVIVLWMLVLLTIIAVTYSNTTRTGTLSTAHFVQTAQARTLAEAGIWLAVNELLKPDGGQRWRKDSTRYTVPFSDGEITLRIQDESGKIDLNSARSELLYSLLQSLDIDMQGAERLNVLQAILDWRDRDNLPRQSGAEDAEYRQRGLDYGAKDGPFNAVDELLLVLGMTHEVYKKMHPALTIHSHQPGVVPEVAPREVLMALPNITPESADNYLATRSQGELTTPALTGVDPRYFSRVRGNTFSISSTGQRAGSRYTVTAVLTLHRNSYPLYSILSWTENSLSLTGEEDTGKQH